MSSRRLQSMILSDENNFEIDDATSVYEALQKNGTAKLMMQ